MPPLGYNIKCDICGYEIEKKCGFVTRNEKNKRVHVGCFAAKIRCEQITEKKLKGIAK